jgi:peptidoglycan/LPS O-acetylase OafA/YrhL
MSATVTVPDAVAPPPRHPRFPMIDGARALAVMSIVLFHAAVFGQAVSGSLPGRLLAHLNFGVALFFLISGFLLYRPLIAHRAGGAPAPAVRDYTKRRFLRIYPAYWVALTVLLLVPGLTGSVPGNLLGLYGLWHTTCLHEFGCRLSQTWSLVVELTFYIALPLYFAVLTWLTRRLQPRTWVRAELAVLAALSAISLGLEFGAFSRTPTWIDATLIGHFFWFALGMGMAVISAGLTGGVIDPPWLRRVAAWPGLTWVLALVVYVALCVWLPASPFVVTSTRAFVTVVVFGLVSALVLLPAVFAERGTSLPERALTQPVIAWIGLISYGIFLWHFAIALDLGSIGHKNPFGIVLLGTVAIVIPVAAASYYLVERPILRLKYRRLRVWPWRSASDQTPRVRAR